MTQQRWEHVETVVRAALNRVFPAAVVRIQQAGHLLFQAAYGQVLCPTSASTWQPCPTQLNTVFDLASVTKVFTATAFMRLVEANQVDLDQPLHELWPAFHGQRPIRPYPDPLNPGSHITVVPATDETVDAGQVTFRHLLTHTSGLPAWRPLYKLGTREAAVEAVLGTYFSYPTGRHVVYSDLGFILLGETVSRLTGQPLPAALETLVLEPLGLDATHFRPTGSAADPPAPAGGLAPTEVCGWRRRRLIGEVDDENAAGMGGVAGHAGLFSTVRDVARLGEVYLYQGGALLRPDTVANMTRCQAEDGTLRRGLAWQLWSPDATSSGHPFSRPACLPRPRRRQAFGHTGFTGTSLWVDPQRELVVVCLTNRVYYGRKDSAGIAQFRVALHQAVVENALESS